MKLRMDSVKETDSTTWTVKSSQCGQWYTITQEQQNCPINCHLLCTECSICAHNNNCNCPDAPIHSTICKHIHLIVRYQHNHTPSPCGDARTPLSHTPIQTDSNYSHMDPAINTFPGSTRFTPQRKEGKLQLLG